MQAAGAGDGNYELAQQKKEELQQMSNELQNCGLPMCASCFVHYPATCGKSRSWHYPDACGGILGHLGSLVSFLDRHGSPDEPLPDSPSYSPAPRR
eukprot:3058736-Pyramimonas_sp.AAC.1